jgi:hypothetical protein
MGRVNSKFLSNRDTVVRLLLFGGRAHVLKVLTERIPVEDRKGYSKKKRRRKEEEEVEKGD